MHNLDVMIGLAREALENGDPGEAVKLLRSQAVKHLDHGELQALYGEALVDSGRLPDGLKVLEDAHRRLPDDLDVLSALGDACFEAGFPERAQAAYQAILDRDAEDADALVSLGLVYFHQERVDLAEQCYRKALAIEAESVFAWHSLGDACFAQGRIDEARQCFEKALELDPEDPQGHFNLAEFLYDNGDLKAAEARCREALRRDPRFGFAWLTLGNICLDQELVQEAVQCFQKFLALEQGPSSKEIRDEVAALVDGLREEI